MKPSIIGSKPARVLSWIVALILCLLPFHALLTTWVTSNFGHPDLFRVWKELLIVLCLPLAGLATFKNPKLKSWLAKSWIVRLIMVYGILQLALGVWALNSDRVDKVALVYGWGINLRFFGFFIVCLIAAATYGLLQRNWSKLVLWPAGIAIAFGLAQHFFLTEDFLRHFGYGPKTIPPFQTVDANSRYVRVQSTLRGPNPLGAYLILIIPAAIAVLRRRRIACSAYAIGALVVLFYSYSRSAWIGAAIAAGIVCWLLINKVPRWWLATATALAILLVGTVYGLRDNQSVQDIFFHHTKASASPLSSNMVRDSAIKDAAADIWHNPFGGGPGTAGPASYRNDHPARIAEDYYLQVAQEVGVIGLAIFLAILALTAKQLWLTRTNLLAKLLLASLVGISFVNLVSHAWADDTLSLLWWGLAGIALAPDILKANKHKANEKTQPKPA